MGCNVKKYKNPYAVELKGERSLITASPEAVANYMGETDPVELMRLHDKIIRFENSVAGLSEDGIGCQKLQTTISNLLKRENQIKMIGCLLLIIIQGMFQRLWIGF